MSTALSNSGTSSSDAACAPRSVSWRGMRPHPPTPAGDKIWPRIGEPSGGGARVEITCVRGHVQLVELRAGALVSEFEELMAEYRCVCCSWKALSFRKLEDPMPRGEPIRYPNQGHRRLEDLKASSQNGAMTNEDRDERASVAGSVDGGESAPFGGDNEQQSSGPNPDGQNADASTDSPPQ